MKITVERANTQETHLPERSASLPPSSYLSHKSTSARRSPRRKTKTPGVKVLLRREVGVSSVKRSSNPETPLLKWKVDEGNEKNDSVETEKSSPKVGRRAGEVVSPRKLASGLWRLHLPELQIHGGRSSGLQIVFLDNTHTQAATHTHTHIQQRTPTAAVHACDILTSSSLSSLRRRSSL